MKSTQRILMVLIEPTPYVLGLLRELEAHLSGKLDVVFLKENDTQSWGVIVPASYTILPVSLMKSVAQLKQIISQNNYSIIHIAGWGNLPCLYLLLWVRFQRIPLSVESDTQLNKYLPVWKKILKYFLYPVLFKLPTIFLPGGTRQRQYLSYYGVPADKIVVTQMTVDVDSLQRQVDNISEMDRAEFRHNHGVQDCDVVFLFVGRLVECKRLHDLIQAFQRLQSPIAKLWIVGSGEQEEYIKLSTQNMSGIYYFGRKSGEDLTQLYVAADVFVLPSLVEQWGLVVNEAMATGNALIVSEQVGCVDDLIIHEKTGLLFPSTNIVDLTKAMERMISETEYRKHLTTQAKDHISSWTLENQAKNVVHAWEQCGLIC